MRRTMNKIVNKKRISRLKKELFLTPEKSTHVLSHRYVLLETLNVTRVETFITFDPLIPINISKRTIFNKMLVFQSSSRLCNFRTNEALPVAKGIGTFQMSQLRI